MHYDIPNNDDLSDRKFWEFLRRLGAQEISDEWRDFGPIRLKFGEDVLLIYLNSWCYHLEGPDDLVQKVMHEMEVD